MTAPTPDIAALMERLNKGTCLGMGAAGQINYIAMAEAMAEARDALTALERALSEERAARPPMVRVDRDLWINPAHVMDMRMDRQHYVNGPGPLYLVITMTDGREHRIEHTAGYLDGTDVYEVQRQIVGGVK